MSSKDLPQKELIRAYIQNHLKQDHEFQKLAAPIREDLLDTFPDEVEISSERTSFSIPLEKIQSDIAKFQIRRTPRSEQSVEKYISSILK